MQFSSGDAEATPAAPVDCCHGNGNACARAVQRPTVRAKTPGKDPVYTHHFTWQPRIPLRHYTLQQGDDNNEGKSFSTTSIPAVEHLMCGSWRESSLFLQRCLRWATLALRKISTLLQQRLQASDWPQTCRSVTMTRAASSSRDTMNCSF